MSSPTGSPPDDSAAQRPDFANVPPTDLVKVGFVFRAHGLDGELKVDPSATGDPARFEALPRVFVGPHPSRVTRHAIASVRYQQTKRGTTVLLGLDGIANRDDAEAVAKMDVFATEEALGLEDDELFADDLVGWTAVTEDGAVQGTVANFMEMPAQDLFVVRTPEDAEVMIPAIDDFIIEIDEEAERIVVRPIDGLMDA
ncbi:ribosome maturation factor RimM [Salinibacter altiplanensis]|uniref:ribosome maturation factor RimM n=1 Tax=Salinibacter altiplanensis TaxID=1803181 RepID=UPI000C9FBCC5|nr:ribosome maturation factor RimM [Salinibacter altiplanensis]